METAINKIISDLSLLQSNTTSFLLSHSKIIRRVFSNDSFMSFYGDYGFGSLDGHAIQIQDDLFKRLNHITEIISVLFVDSLQIHNKDFEILKKKITATISQNSNTFQKNIQEEVSYTNQNFEEVKNLISKLYPASNPEPIIIPDTNALYENTEIETWDFSDFKSFSIAITPSVLKDLDRHKIEHRNESVRFKAIKLINKLKEYRRRGKLSDGVVVVKDKISLFTIATEPNFDKTLNWLDKGNDDDRLIAETLEIIRKYGNRPILLVTSDINLQNKCEVADLVFIEPPEKI